MYFFKQMKPKKLDERSIKDINGYESDLKKLSEYKVSEVSQDDDEDLPPLIQVSYYFSDFSIS